MSVAGAVRVAGDSDVPAMATLRAAWREQPADHDFVAAFEAWWERERDQRVTWLAEVDGTPVGMLNMLVFTRMPSPGRVRSQWGYVANAFVLTAHRGAGLGTALVDAATSYADAHDFVRLVLSPSERSVPLYERAGFNSDHSLLVREG